MDDYSALAQRIAVSVSGVRGSLILSRDGLVLGAHPEGDESLAKPAWLKFVTLGEPDRSFVEFADQVWAFVKRGPYAAFAVAEAGTARRPRRSDGAGAAERRGGSRRGGTPCACPMRRPRPRASPARRCTRGRRPTVEADSPTRGSRRARRRTGSRLRPPTPGGLGRRPAARDAGDPGRAVGGAGRCRRSREKLAGEVPEARRPGPRGDDEDARSTGSCWRKSSRGCFRWTRTDDEESS